MKTIKNKLLLAAIALVGLVVGGCLLSGTFVIEEDFAFTANSSNPYFVDVDATTNADWQDHKDKIDLIDAVGFTMTMNNTRSGAVTFNVYVAPWAATQQYTTKEELDAHAYIVLEDLTVPTGVSTMSYAESLTHLKNIDQLKAVAKIGKFHYYGIATGGTGGSFTVDPGKVIITFTAGK